VDSLSAPGSTQLRQQVAYIFTRLLVSRLVDPTTSNFRLNSNFRSLAVEINMSTRSTKRSTGQNKSQTQPVVAPSKKKLPHKSKRSLKGRHRSKNEDDNDIEYTVEEILTMEKSGTDLYYLVSWVGYDEITWEPAKSIPATFVRDFKKRIETHTKTCAGSNVQKCVDMVDASRDGGNPKWLFKVSWKGCNHLTWENENNVPAALAAKIRQAVDNGPKINLDTTMRLEAENEAYSTEKEAENDNDKDNTYDVEEILTMEKVGTQWNYLVSWVGYDDITWEPAKNIPSNFVKQFKKTIEHHAKNCATGMVKNCLDMVDASRQGNDVKWLFKVTWSGCKHRTWEYENKVPAALVAAIRRTIHGREERDTEAMVCPDATTNQTPTNEADKISATARMLESMRESPAPSDASESDASDGAASDSAASSPERQNASRRNNKQKKGRQTARSCGPASVDKPDDVPSVSVAPVCPVCGEADGLGSSCVSCKRPMHHFCATGVCQEMKLKDSNGNDVVEFPNDMCYCSTDCYNGVPLPTRKRQRSLTTRDCNQPEYLHEIADARGLSDKESTSDAPAALPSASRKKPRSSRAQQDSVASLKSPPSSRDPLLYQMVAYSADHEDWMETEVPVVRTKTGKIKKSRAALYEQAKGYFLTGRIHRARAAKGTSRGGEKKYEVRWTQTGFQKTQHIHRLTEAQVRRGIANYKSLSGETLSSKTFAHICQVPESEAVDLDVDLDDYVIMDAGANDMLMEQVYPENLKVIEELKTLEFSATRQLEEPKDLYMHDDGTRDTKLKKEMSKFFKTASSSFFAYLPLPFWRSVVEQTNLYAKKAAEEKRAEFKSAAITLDEMMKFIGILFYMSVVSKGEYSNYWGPQVEGKILGVEQPGLETLMSRKRFIYIRSNLSFVCDVSREALRRDPAARIRPLINTFKSSCLLYVDLGRNLAVDESSIACRSKYGRHLIVYNASKPTGKYHFKIYACCCATSWLMVNFRLHCSSSMEDRLKGVMTASEAQQLQADLSFSSTVRQIVLEVVDPLRGSKRIVNTDNFYTSVKLLSSLREFGLYGRGTVKESSAHFPKAHMLSKKADEERGSSLQGVCATERIVAASWRDGTTVNVISNADSSSMGSVNRLVGQVHDSFPAPACIAEYNKHMQGVDRLDQLRAKYSIADGHSMQKWHLKLALAFIDMARVNAYVTKRMRDKNKPSRNPHQDFMVELASELISGKWKDSVDDGGLFVAELTRASNQSSQTPSTLSRPPPTPSTPAPSCSFVLSSAMFPEATRGKRGCKVCVFEGRPATMKTNYCEQHKICLCTCTYPIIPSMATIVCPYSDWTCWRKFHEYYLPRGLYNANGNIMRKSQLHLARRALNLSETGLEDTPRHLDRAQAEPEPEDTSTPSDRDEVQIEPGLADPPSQSDPAQFQSFTRLLQNYRPSADSQSAPETSPPTQSVPATSPPTLVVSPFDGAAANALLEEQPSPYPTPTYPTPSPSYLHPAGSDYSFRDDDIRGSDVSYDFKP